MPGSQKVLKAREQKKNREQGIGDAQGRIPHRVKVEKVQVACAQCQGTQRMTKTNSEARMHWESRHPSCTFEQCFPGQTYVPVASAVATATTTKPKPKPNSDISSDSITTSLADTTITDTNDAPVSVFNAPVSKKKPKKVEDLSFLTAALAANPNKSKGGKKK